MRQSPSQRSAAAQGEGGSGFPDAVDFRYPKLARVVIRAGAGVNEPPAVLRAWRTSAVVVAVNRSLADSEPVAGLMSALAHAGIEARLFTGAMQHCPLQVAIELARATLQARADTLIAIGGSSVSDTAKAACLLQGFAAPTATPGDSRSPGDSRQSGDSRPPRIDLASLRTRIDAVDGVSQRLTSRLIAIPTTLSGGEFTPVVGITDPEHGHKVVLRHPDLCADLVILDPVLLEATPDALWASTGFKLLDHALERLLARNHQALIDAQCSFGIRSLLPRLEPSLGDGPAAARARAELAQVLWVIQSSHGNVGTGLSHALSHQIGSLYGLDHGCGSAICLPATLRMLARSGRIDAGRRRLLRAAFGVDDGLPGTDHDGENLEPIVAMLTALRERLKLPASLSEAGIEAIDAERVARATLEDPTARATPGAPLTLDEVSALVETL